MRKLLPLLAAGTLALAGPAKADGLSHLPLLSEVAPQAVAVSPHVPRMGVHWAQPANMPTGPIYCVIEGRVVCVEYMFRASDLAAGANWQGLGAGIRTPPITRIDMEYKPDGVGPLREPIYQLHIWFADEAVLARH